MKNFSFLILLLSFFIALPSKANPGKEKGTFIKIRKQFEKIDKNSDGLLSREEMLEAHRDRIDKLFLKFDKNDDKKLSKRELRAVRQEMKKRIDKVRTEEK